MASEQEKYLRFDVPARSLSKPRMALHLMRGILAFPFYWSAALLLGCPGMRSRWRCMLLGAKLLLAKDLANAYRCVVWPLDSVRYFEFDFFWKAFRARRPTTLLDVSSPRLFLAMALAARPALSIEGVNPDANDLSRTSALLGALGFSRRCALSRRSVAELAATERKFELVTCMSVLEHIADDLDAVEVMWSRVAPGGSLLLSVPCAATACDEYTNVDEYGLLEQDRNGFVFWQRYYDSARLQTIFAITGSPASMSIFGERSPGLYDADVRAKRSNLRYPRWRDPYTLVRTFKPYADVADLPGMGVVALEFHKPGLGAPCVESEP